MLRLSDLSCQSPNLAPKARLASADLPFCSKCDSTLDADDGCILLIWQLDWAVHGPWLISGGLMRHGTWLMAQDLETSFELSFLAKTTCHYDLSRGISPLRSRILRPSRSVLTMSFPQTDRQCPKLRDNHGVAHHHWFLRAI